MLDIAYLLLGVLGLLVLAFYARALDRV